MRNSFLFVFFIFLFGYVSSGFSSPVAYGIITNIQKSTHKLTALRNNGSFRDFPSGKKVYIFKKRKAVGFATVLIQNYSSFTAEYSNNPDIERGDLILIQPDDINNIFKQGKTVINFSDLVFDTHGWISKAKFTSKNSEGKNETITQDRKLILGDKTGVLQEESPFYFILETSQIKEFNFQWLQNKLISVSVLLKDNSTIACREILTPYIFSKVMPPQSMRNENVSVTIELISKKETNQIDPLALPLAVEIKENPEYFTGKYIYKIKVYANGLFINEFALNKNLWIHRVFKDTFYFSGYNLQKGQNLIEFFTVQTENHNGYFFETGDEKLIGKTQIEFDVDHLKHEFLVSKEGLAGFQLRH